MANQVSGAKELQMHQKGYLLLFWRLYSVIFEARIALIVAPQAGPLITPSRQFFPYFTPSRRNIFHITFTRTISQYKHLFQRSDMHHHYPFSLVKFEHKYCSKTHSQQSMFTTMVSQKIGARLDQAENREYHVEVTVPKQCLDFI